MQRDFGRLGRTYSSGSLPGMSLCSVHVCVSWRARKRTPCDPDKLIMGACRLLVRFTVRMRACCLSSFEDEIAICVFGAGDPERARLIRAPPGGDALRFDIVGAAGWQQGECKLNAARTLAHERVGPAGISRILRSDICTPHRLLGIYDRASVHFESSSSKPDRLYFDPSHSFT